MTPVLETERLTLRYLVEEDAEWLCEMDGDPEVMRYITGTLSPSREKSVVWIRTIQEHFYDTGSRYGCWATTLKETGEAIGWFILRPAPDYRFAREVEFQADELELGYRFRRQFWGRGLATEGSLALVRYGLEDTAVRAIVAVALVANRASTRVMEKAGLTRVAEYPLPGYDTPAVTYALSRQSVIE